MFAIRHSSRSAGRFVLRSSLCPSTAGCLLLLIALAFSGQSLRAQNPQLAVDFSSNTGAVQHGATGWLYGQAETGIPTTNLMQPLHPQVAAQKPPQGLQHPGGDALQVIQPFVDAGGQQMEIYMQDIYRTFYPDNGIADYTAKVKTMMQLLVTNPNHAHFVYNPFNEPDGEIYGKYGVGITNLPRFESDWMTIYRVIRSYDPNAVIIGPGFYNYSSSVYRQFFTFAQANNVLPDQTSWHELQSNFFSGYLGRYTDYRGIEKSLGITSRPIVINEYAESTGDLGVPGRLVQFISRFESTKVSACLAYWIPSGMLDGLGAMSDPNQATGAWWLYQWYAGMTGDTVQVTPPNANAPGLAGVASLDMMQQQARVLLGGTSGDVNVAMTGLGTVAGFAKGIHVTMWGVDQSAFNPSAGPYYIGERDYPNAGTGTVVTVPNTQVSSAYYLVVTPATSLKKANTVNRYEAEYSELSGSATAAYGTAKGYSGTGFVDNLQAGSSVEFAITVPSSGFYNANLRYSSPLARPLDVILNGQEVNLVLLEPTGSANHWATKPGKLFLQAGINWLALKGNADSNGIKLDYLDVAATDGVITTYEASDPANTLGGAAIAQQDTNAPGGSNVAFIGNGAANYLQFNTVNAPVAGLYRMMVTFTNGEKYTGASDPVYRFAQISVNGAPARQVYFTNTFSYSAYTTQEVDIYLTHGINTILFSNPTTGTSPNIESGYAPNIANIAIAQAFQ